MSGAPGTSDDPRADVAGDGSDDAPDGPTLSAALKLTGLAETGGHAKRMIQSGEVRVNGAVETRRKRRLRAGDEIEVEGDRFVIELAEDEPDGETPDGATGGDPGDARDTNAN